MSLGRGFFVRPAGTPVTQAVNLGPALNALYFDDYLPLTHEAAMRLCDFQTCSLNFGDKQTVVF